MKTTKRTVKRAWAVLTRDWSSPIPDEWLCNLTAGVQLPIAQGRGSYKETPRGLRLWLGETPEGDIFLPPDAYQVWEDITVTVTQTSRVRRT